MEENKFEGFTFKLALVDTIPVILFAAAAGIINMKLHSILFLIGIISCLFGGIGKVAWKIILAYSKKDIQFLFKQMRITMPLGFLIMFIVILLNINNINWLLVGQRITSFPAILFFILGTLGIIAMGILAKKLDPNDAKSNWIEQCTNIVAQGAFCIGTYIAIFF